MEEKVQMLSKLIEPMGFAYDPKQDIFLSRTDAWQRDYGYSSLFDRTAPFFQMVFDCEPIYFDYEGKTWMIELWKGQYGINTGCELGIYQADALLSSSERKRFHFHAITDEEMLPVHIDFHKKGRLLFTLSELVAGRVLYGIVLPAAAAPDAYFHRISKSAHGVRFHRCASGKQPPPGHRLRRRPNHNVLF